MRVLLLTHSFNSLAQRLYVELARQGHELSVEFDIHDDVTCDAVNRFRPDLVLCPFLKRAIPSAVWRRHLCLVVHPGPPGDRGPSALDWAILLGKERWGVTVLQATGDMDAGPVWGSAEFSMRSASKSSLYRNEVTEAAVHAVSTAFERIGSGKPPLLTPGRLSHSWQPMLPQVQRAIDWQRDTSSVVIRKIQSGDGFPGVEDSLFGRRFRLYDAHPEMRLRGSPGQLIARHHEAVCRATVDGAVWIGQLQPAGTGAPEFKRPATLALGAFAEGLPIEHNPGDGAAGYDEIRYDERGTVGYLHFDFYNGALSTVQCRRLLDAYRHARARPTRVIVLMGGHDFWCNGMHLHCIEAAASAADASWDNIHAIDDLALEILSTDSHFTLSALQGNAGAGGVFLALAADRSIARSGVVLNPHYRNMGNLYGSEYWTYLLPRRLGQQGAKSLMALRLPLDAAAAHACGLIDAHTGPAREDFAALIEVEAASLGAATGFESRLAAKREARRTDELIRPLADYRTAELERMRLNFFGFDPSYHIARHRFVHRTPQAWTPLHLALHRQPGYVPPPLPGNA